MDTAHAPAPSHKAIELDATALLMAAKYEDLERLQSTLGEDQITPSLRETFARSYLAQGNALVGQAKAKSDKEADALFAAAGKKYAAALAIKPTMHEALNNWGTALSDQGKFEDASEKYAAALAIKPDLHEALYNWGNTLSDQGKFEDASEKYAAALAIKPDMHKAFNNWGTALFNQARMKSDVDADALYLAASEKYAAALAIKPDMYKAFNNWGIALSHQAQTKSGAKADALFTAAVAKYAAALAIKPDYHETLNNWGTTLLNQAKTKDNDEAQQMLEEAEARLLKAEEIRAGSGSYNLACVAARRGDAASCQKWLQRCRENGALPDSRHLLADLDLASMRDQPWFRAFLEGT